MHQLNWLNTHSLKLKSHYNLSISAASILFNLVKAKNTEIKPLL